LPGPAMRRLVVTRVELAELSMKGMREVHMTCIIRVCVSKDSTNHPIWNRAGFVHALNTNSIMANVRQSKIELTGPSTNMNLKIPAMSHRHGDARYSSSTVSVGMAA